MFSLFLFILALVHTLPTSAEVSNEVRNCTCGFYDSQTGELFTDSIIAYFNETTRLPKDFIAEKWSRGYAKDWNALYREAADPANIRLNNSKSLQLLVQPSTEDHLVVGASLRTTRRDIQHGSFRALIKSPVRNKRGSAATMMWQYNETETTELSIMSTNKNSEAWVGTFVNHEFTTRNLGMNYTQLLEEPAANRNYTTMGGGLVNGSVDPWDYVEYRIDWTTDFINFYIGGNLTRQVLHKDNTGMPSVPSAFFFKHWSSGNQFSMEGPPARESVAEIGWIRMFFNSSSMNVDAREDFIARCPQPGGLPCSMDDIALRGSTSYSDVATESWKQTPPKSVRHMPTLWISISCVTCSALLLIHTFLRRIIPKINTDIHKPASVSPSISTMNPSEANAYVGESNDTSSNSSSKSIHKHGSADDLAIEKLEPNTGSPSLGGSTPKDGLSRHNSRIDHLAGLTAVCSLFVTLMHFGLTFVPAMVIPGAPYHQKSEYWAQKIIGPFLLNQMWLGVFFTTSARFLSAPYLRKGKIDDIAKAAVRRTPRLMIPVASIALIEYFLIDVGATSYLQYIPSLTWSTWPYVTRYQNFGQYVSEILELTFLIPNAVPHITLHFCTGVLWTIAVQLQGTWLVLLGVIVVYEIKTPWKRMCFYAFCLVNHWYAQSWGTYLWIGLILTDLDVSYDWKTYLHSRPRAYYPVMLFFCMCVATGFAVNLVPNWVEGLNINFATIERNIHPQPSTGERLGNTAQAGYPSYYEPRVNGLLFAGGMQAIVELSTSIQWLLSTPPFLIFFPHVFTIYLLHGLVFWTWGSWLMVFLAGRGFTYGINVIIVGVTSYGLLLLSLPIVTPLIEALGKDVTALVWMTAQEKSPPRRRTLFPFPEDIFTGRELNKLPGKEEADVETGQGKRTEGNGTLSSSHARDKGKAREKVEEHELHAFSTDERVTRISTS
ncbi:hypothetical protein EJ02DRAFT_396698 [Clathrospora elynae]|uniref:GH16 domain-containing protein n=1 Tax=Clathrospora elynae TaxID=706981 RepID=A0A6A5SZN1_9PLEO|nr:hypothetical protein EJ02DRAFT_396698 [Clathrospora elynae]